MNVQTSGLALEEIDTLFGKDQIATADEELGDKAITIEEEHDP